ncbi:MAG TPA: hypothetical protein VKT52_00640, partial [Ktedonobacterales bacterium]|nr:hypothetical protein [Ktedonobacterales bacterium]
MVSETLAGIAAGAVGTMALDVATYTDMIIRGRPSSGVPAQVAGTLAEGVGLDLSAGSDGDVDAAKQKAESRKSGLGALMGYATGIGIGAAYGMVRPYLGRWSLPLAGATLGVAAMAAGDAPAVVTGATDPRTWGA